MRIPTRSLLCLMLGACSCSRTADPADPVEVTAPPPVAVHGSGTGQSAAEQRHALLHDEQARTLQQAVSIVHRYLGALASGDLETANALWATGAPPPTPDDAALRALGTYSVRINTGTPRPLPPHQVSWRLLEIPVRMRIGGRGHAHDWNGWYRLQRNADNDGWVLVGASMRPQLD